MTTIVNLAPSQRSSQQPSPLIQTRPWHRVHWVPLAVILVAQAGLSARLLHVYPASTDESLYIYSGHQLIHEMWHGGGSPYYEDWLSGAPILYPVLAALADHLGGLIEVRLMSTCFMLVATALLYGTARRLFGYWPAVAAAGLFAGLGVTQGLGVLATYDALALLLTALAAYCAVRAAEKGATIRWLLLVVPVLVLANWVKYASVLFDPIVLGLAALLLSRAGWAQVRQRAIALGVTMTALLGVTVYLAGSAYWHGITYTTIARKSGAQAQFGLTGTESARAIVLSSWDLIGLILALGSLALIVALPRQRERRNLLILAILLIAGTLVTVENIHLHNDQSLSKHDDFGVWFTCIAAGYALARSAELTRRLPVRLSVATVAVLATAWIGGHYSAHPTAGDQSSSDTSLAAFAVLRPYLAIPKGRFLLGGLADYRMLYDNHLTVPWWQFTDDEYVKYPIPGRGGDWHGQASGLACGATGLHAPGPACMYLEGPSGYRAAIRAHSFDLISMIGGHGTSQDNVIEETVEHTPGYVLLTRLGGAPTWIYAPDYKEHGHGR
jgi:hypothetical protein